MFTKQSVQILLGLWNVIYYRCFIKEGYFLSVKKHLFKFTTDYMISTVPWLNTFMLVPLTDMCSCKLWWAWATSVFDIWYVEKCVSSNPAIFVAFTRGNFVSSNLNPCSLSHEESAKTFVWRLESAYTINPNIKTNCFSTQKENRSREETSIRQCARSSPNKGDVTPLPIYDILLLRKGFAFNNNKALMFIGSALPTCNFRTEFITQLN